MKSDSKTSKTRKTFSKTVQIFLFSSTELEVFNTLQKIFSDSLFLFYQDLICILFINLNVIKSETEFETIIYHVKNKLKYLKNNKKMISLLCIQIQLILFLSR